MKTHNFIIATTRPELLVKQITAFTSIKNGRKLNFYVFNDKETKSNKFLNEISKLKENLPETNIHYFNINKQIKIIENAASKYSPILNVNKEDIYNCFKENNNFYGIRSIQNKSIFIFYLVNKDSGSIIHKIDDDIFPYEADRQKDIVNIIIKKDFFEKKEEAINQDINIFSGSNYTIDSPSPLVNYADFTEFLFNFYNIARGKSLDRKIGDDILRISPSGVRKVFDKLNLLKVLPINEDYTFKEVILSLERYSELIEGGNSRIIINDNKLNQNGINKFFPGGCVSFIYENLPTLTPLFGNQDLLWELIETLEGKKLLTDGYIGHIKSLSGRVSIVDDLKDSSYKHPTSITYSVYKYLAEKNPNERGIIGFERNFNTPMNIWLRESKHYSNEIINNLNDKRNWYSDENKFVSTQKIKSICLKFINNYRKIKKNFSYSNKDVTELMSKYYKDKGTFDRLLSRIVAK